MATWNIFPKNNSQSNRERVWFSPDEPWHTVLISTSSTKKFYFSSTSISGITDSFSFPPKWVRWSSRNFNIWRRKLMRVARLKTRGQVNLSGNEWTFNWIWKLLRNDDVETVFYFGEYPSGKRNPRKMEKTFRRKKEDNCKRKVELRRSSKCTSRTLQRKICKYFGKKLNLNLDLYKHVYILSLNKVKIKEAANCLDFLIVDLHDRKLF